MGTKLISHKEDVKVAEDFGPSVANLKGKTMTKNMYQICIYVVLIPPIIMKQFYNITLGRKIMYDNSIQ